MPSEVIMIRQITYYHNYYYIPISLIFRDRATSFNMLSQVIGFPQYNSYNHYNVMLIKPMYLQITLYTTLSIQSLSV